MDNDCKSPTASGMHMVHNQRVLGEGELSHTKNRCKYYNKESECCQRTEIKCYDVPHCGDYEEKDDVSLAKSKPEPVYPQKSPERPLRVTLPAEQKYYRRNECLSEKTDDIRQVADVQFANEDLSKRKETVRRYLNGFTVTYEHTNDAGWHCFEIYGIKKALSYHLITFFDMEPECVTCHYEGTNNKSHDVSPFQIKKGRSVNMITLPEKNIVLKIRVNLPHPYIDNKIVFVFLEQKKS